MMTMKDAPLIRMSRADLKAILVRTAIGIIASETLVIGALYAMHATSFGYGIFFSFVCPAILGPYFSWQERKRLHVLQRYQGELEATNRQLQTALSEVRELRGLLPICAACKKIRNDEGAWDQIEVYISRHTDAQFTHGICPECSVQLYGDLLPEMATADSQALD
jgi:hypothetical protein